MKTTTQNTKFGLKSRPEQSSTGGKANARRKLQLPDPAQTEMFGLIWKPFKHHFRLRPNDVFRFEGNLCRVIRINECAAVVLMNLPPKEFKTRFDKEVRFQPKPVIFRISPHSDVQILNRKNV